MIDATHESHFRHVNVMSSNEVVIFSLSDHCIGHAEKIELSLINSIGVCVAGRLLLAVHARLILSSLHQSHFNLVGGYSHYFNSLSSLLRCGLHDLIRRELGS